MDIKQLANITQKFPWEAIANKLPTKKTKEEFDAIRAEFKDLLDRLEANQLDPEIQQKIETIAAKFQAISKTINTKLHPGAELYSKARLNEIVTWNMCSYAERALYLAGMASTDKTVHEPYRTQIVNQAADACLTRYRQAYKIREYLVAKLEGAVDAQVEFTINQLCTSLLNQLIYFSNLAYQRNSDHTLSAYHAGLAHLIVGQERKASGLRKEADYFFQAAMDIANKMKVPAPRMHYMQRQYHITNYDEFLTFRRLSKKHTPFRDRLRFLHDAAKSLDDSSILIPRDHFNVDWVVGTGQRTASVAGVLLALYAVSDIEMGPVKTAIEQLWHGVVNLVLPNDPAMAEAVQQGANVVAANTGGLATLAANTGGLAGLGAGSGAWVSKFAMLA